MGWLCHRRQLHALILFGGLLLGFGPQGHAQTGNTPYPPFTASVGTFETDRFTGTLLGNIPFEVPSGRHGVQPGLTLSYRSDRGNGWVGAGWELEVGAIERNNQPGVNFGGDDYLLRLNGTTVHLINTGQTDGSGNPLYAAEIERRFYRIQKITSSYWQVTDPTGTRYLFGQTAASRQDNPGNPTQIFRWSLDQVIDPHGNYMLLSYFKNQGQIYLDEIDYTGCCNPQAPTLLPADRVNFYREGRSDTPVSYSTGFPVTTAFRLKTIDVSAGGSRVRLYQLTYSESGNPVRSVVTNVQQFGKNAVLSLPMLTFLYQAAGSGWRTSTPRGPAVAMPVTSSCLSGDLDGDGKADMWCESGNNSGLWTVALSTGSGWTTTTGQSGPAIATPVTDSCLIGDWNGDGKTDMFCESSGNTGIWTFALSNWGPSTSGWITASQTVGVIPKPLSTFCMTGDIDGDGVTDFWCEVQLGKWAVLFSSTLSASIIDGPQIALPVSAYCLGGDLDGDGKTDMWCESGSNTGLWTVALSTGSGWAGGWPIVPPALPPTWNGPQIALPVSTYCLSGELNGDKKTDMWCETGNNSGVWTVGLSTGSGWSITTGQSGPTMPTPVSTSCLSGDHNGDRKMDMWCETAGNTGVWITALSAGDQTAPLISLTNGIGGAVTVTYNFNSTFRTVSSITACDNYNSATMTCAGAASFTSYVYAGSFYDSRAHEFRGFNVVTATGPLGPDGERQVTKSWFHQGNDTAVDVNDPTCGGDIPCVGYTQGRPYRIEVTDGSGRLYSEQTISYGQDADGMAPYFTPPLQVDTSICDGGGCDKQTRVVYTYDPTYGNLLEEDQYGDLSDSTDDRTVAHGYAPNVADWIISLPATATVYGGIGTGGTVFSDSRFYYDNAASSGTAPTLGDLTKTERWLDTSGAWLPVTTSYDGYGNPLTVTDALGHTTANCYDAGATYLQRVTNALLQVTRTDYYGVSWNPACGSAPPPFVGSGLNGLVKSVTDPNGAETTTIYDALGRTSIVTNPDLSSTGYSYLNFGTVGLQSVRTDRPAGLSAWNYFDGLGRTIQEKKTGPDSNLIAVQTQYNTTGTVARRSLPYFDGVDTPVWRQFHYDPVGRVVEVIHPDGSRTLSCEDDWVTVTIDVNNHRTRTVRDASARVVEVDGYQGLHGSCTTDVQTPYAVTRYQYDVLGDLRFVTDAEGNQTEIRYDSLARRIALHDPDRGDSLYRYDDAGNLIQQVDANGQIVVMGYDPLNRITTRTYSGVDSTPPSTPTLLSATAAGGHQVDLVWTASTDAVGVTGYRVERCQGTGCSTFSVIATTSGTAYSDTGVIDATDYSYEVLAVDAAGNQSAVSNVLSATTPDTTLPTMPTGVAAAVGNGQITLSWTASTDNVGVTGYRVERCEGVGCTTFAQVGAPTTPGYIDTGLLPDTSYSYRVLAEDAALNLSPAACCVTTNTAAWTVAPMPTPRAQLAVGVINGLLYAVGGSNGGGALKTVEVYDPLTNTWTVRAPMPTPRFDLAVGVVNGILYAVGGANSTALALKTVEAYDPSTDTWTAKAPLPEARSGLAVGVANDGSGDKLYAVTGKDATETLVGTIYKYNPATDGWILADPNRIPRYEPAVGVNNGALPLYIVGGANGGGAIGAVEAYNPGTSIVPAPLPTPRAGLGAGVVNGRLYAVGGYNTAYLKTVESYNPSTNSWTAGLPLSVQRGGLAVGVVNNILYAVGGYNGVYLNTVEAYLPAALTDTLPPTVPSNVTATVLSSSQVMLAWTASTDDLALAGYQVERCQGTGCTTFAQVAVSPTAGYTDTGLAAGTSYRYRVRAVDAAWNQSAYSSIVDVATPPDTTPPTAPTTLTAIVINSSQITLTWTASTDDVGVADYQVERCQGTGCTTFAQVGVSATAQYHDTALAAGATYRYRVRAVDPTGNLSAYSTTVTALTPLAPPSNLTAVAVSSNQVILSWTAAASSAGITGYVVERCQGIGCTFFTQIATPATTNYTDTGVVGALYRYRVRGVDANGNPSPYSNIVSVTFADLVPPTAPSDLTATGISSNQINLAWNPSMTSAGIMGYRVERCQGTGCTTFAQIDLTTSTSYSDTGLTGGFTYRYRIRAVDLVGLLSAYSNTANATTPYLQYRLPVSTGTFSSTWVQVGCSAVSNAYQCVDDPVGSPNNGSNYLRSQNTPGNDAIFGITPFSIPVSATVQLVRVTVVAIANSVSADLQPALQVNGTVYLAPTQPLTSSWAVYSYDWPFNPRTGLLWTAADVNGTGTNPLQGLGIHSGNGNESVTQVYVTATYQPDTIPPTSPANLAAAAMNSHTIALSWTPSTDNMGLAGYQIERCQGTGCSNFAQVATSPASGNSVPVRLLVGSSAVASTPAGLYVDTVHNEIGVVNKTANSITIYGRTANGTEVPIRTISGASTGLNSPLGIYVDTVNDEIGVVNSVGNSVTVYSRTATGNVAPLRMISGANTILSSPAGLYVDTVNDEIGVVNSATNRVTVFSRTASGNVAPLRTNSGSTTALFAPAGIYVDTVHNEVGVVNAGNNSVTVYSRTAASNTAPLRTISGASTGLISPAGIYVDTANDEIGVVNKGSNSVTVYNRTATGNTAPLRTLNGSVTGLVTPTGLYVDMVNNEIGVVNSAANSVTVYSRTAAGNTAPLRTLTSRAGLYVDTVNNEIGVANSTANTVTIYSRTGVGTVSPLRILPSYAGIYVDTVNDEIGVVNSTSNSVTIYSRTATGNTTPLRTLSGPSTGLSGPMGIYIDTAHNEIGVVNSIANSISVYSRTANGNVAPLRTISGAGTGLSNPAGLYVDTAHNEIGVVNSTGNSVTVYNRTATGNIAPARTLTGPSTGLSSPAGVYVDTVHDEIGVVNKGTNSVTVYSRTVSGDTAPLRTLNGASTGLNTPTGLYVDTDNNEIGVVNSGNSSVTIYSRTANGVVAPLRVIIGASTGLSTPVGLYVDTDNNEIGVVNNGAKSVTTYSLTANGNLAPLRTLTGPGTGPSTPAGLYVDTANNEIGVVNSTANSVTIYDRTAMVPLRTLSGLSTGLNNPAGVYVDTVNDQIGVANSGNNSVTIYSRTANGDVAPVRTLAGLTTGLSNPSGVYVDTVNNEIGVVNSGNNSVTVYSRTANGNVAPLRTISGSGTGLNGPAGIYVDTLNNLIGVANSIANSVTLYSRTANGNVSPVRTVVGPNTALSGPAGLYVDTVNNEIGVISTAANRVTVYDCTATFCDKGLSSLTSFSYQVRALDLGGNLSGYSNSATASTPVIPGDVTLSGRVDGNDLIALSAAFGSSPGDPNWNANADLNNNGTVDGPDLSILAMHYGEE